MQATQSRTHGTVAVIGLGAMGARMATRLLETGHAVTVTNRTSERARPLAERGAKVETSPRLAARGAEVVISCVSDDDAARASWLDPADGALAGMEPGAIGVESSTLTPACVRALSEAARARGIALLDAPVVGSRPHAERGQLVHLVGGDASALERARPVLESLGSAVHHVGGSGNGAALKLMVNALFGVQVAALAELLGWAEKAGLGAARTMQVLESLAVTSPAAKAAGGAMVSGQHAPLFPIRLVAKDFGYIERAAKSVGAATPISSTTRALYTQAVEAGHGELHITGVAALHA